jgi:hypothetical protein
MEFIIGAIVVLALGYFAFFRKKDVPAVTVETSTPYKVETAPVNEATPEPVVEPPVASMPIGIEAIVATPVVETAPAKKTRAPRTPKTEASPTKKATKEKAPAKAKANKVVAKKPAARTASKTKKA